MPISIRDLEEAAAGGWRAPDESRLGCGAGPRVTSGHQQPGAEVRRVAGQQVGVAFRPPVLHP